MRSRSSLLALVLVGAACSDPAPEGSGGASSSSGAGTGTATDPTGDAPTSAATSDAPTSAATSTTGDATASDGTTTGAASDASTGGTTGALTTGDTGTMSGDPQTTGTTGTTGEQVCGASLGAGEHTIELEHGGRTRMALVHVPASVDLMAPTPLVLNFHGFTQTAEQMAGFTGMSAKADAAGFIVVYPQGVDTSWNAGACCGNAMTQKIDDVGFVRALVGELEAQLCIDASRVYATGMSNGGFMTHRLACEAADIFAAAAPVSAVNGTTPCEPTRPMPVLMFNGTADLLVAYNGGGNFGKSAPQTFDEWADRDGCTGEPVPGKQAGSASCETHATCDADVAVSFCTIAGMGHCWPGQPACPYGVPNTDLSANDEMWAFFSAYTLP